MKRSIEKEKKMFKLTALQDVIKKANKSKVNVGSTVEIKYIDEDDGVEEYQIVGSQEADPFAFKISNESPIAKALLNRRVGDVVSVDSPNGIYQVEITSIR